MGALVREAVETLSEGLALATCSVEVRTKDRIHGVWDRLRIQQVVANLLTNAMKYGRGRPIAVTVDWARHGAATNAISHRGARVPPTQQGTTFQAFEPCSHLPRVGGAGPGLY